MHSHKHEVLVRQRVKTAMQVAIRTASNVRSIHRPPVIDIESFWELVLEILRGQSAIWRWAANPSQFRAVMGTIINARIEYIAPADAVKVENPMLDAIDIWIAIISPGKSQL